MLLKFVLPKFHSPKRFRCKREVQEKVRVYGLSESLKYCRKSENSTIDTHCTHVKFKVWNMYGSSDGHYIICIEKNVWICSIADLLIKDTIITIIKNTAQLRI